MAEVKWIKLNVDMFDDEKIKLIQAMPEGDSLLLIWIKLILLAGKTNEGGYIYINEDMPYTEEMLSVIINKPLAIIRLAIETFNRLGMLENDNKGIYLVNFEKHQNLEKMQKIREQTRLRVAKHREKLKECNAVTQNVTQCNATDIDIDKDIDKNKKEINKEKSSCCYAEKQWNRLLNGTEISAFNEFDDTYGYEKVKEAIDISCMNNKCTASYVKGILNKQPKQPDWYNKDIKKEEVSYDELEELEGLFKEFKEK